MSFSSFLLLNISGIRPTHPPPNRPIPAKTPRYRIPQGETCDFRPQGGDQHIRTSPRKFERGRPNPQGRAVGWPRVFEEIRRLPVPLVANAVSSSVNSTDLRARWSSAISNLGFLMPTPVCFQFEWAVIFSNALSLLYLNQAEGVCSGRWRGPPAAAHYIGTTSEALDLAVRRAADYRSGRRLWIEATGEELTKLGPVLRVLLSASAPLELSVMVTTNGRLPNNMPAGENFLMRDRRGLAAEACHASQRLADG